MTASKYPLAFDAAGNPITIPPEAVGWRVRRGGGRRGRPRSVFDAGTGRQLDVGLESTLQDLIEFGLPPDRYRLEAIDAGGQVIADVVAVVEVPGVDDGDALVPTEPVTTALAQTLQLLGRAVEANCRTMMAMASAFGSVRPLPPVVVAPEAAGAPSPDPDKMMKWVQDMIATAATSWAEGKASVGAAK